MLLEGNVAGDVYSGQVFVRYFRQLLALAP